MPALVIIAVVVLVALAGAMLASASKRNEGAAARGQLSRETLKRDASRRAADRSGDAAPGLKGRELEKSLLIERGGEVASAASMAPTVWVPPDAESIGVSRRQFLNRSIIGLMVLSIASFAAASFTAFLWPSGAGGFGGKVKVGKVSDLLQQIKASNGFLYKPEAKAWLVAYPESALPKAQVAYKGQACLPGMEKGILAIYQKCVHLGCRVPSCATSQWFECPCHGSQYNQVGEKKGGPAPRGLDRFPIEVGGDGSVTIDTAGAKIIQGPPIGTNTTGQEAQGPHCV